MGETKVDRTFFEESHPRMCVVQFELLVFHQENGALKFPLHPVGACCWDVQIGRVNTSDCPHRHDGEASILLPSDDGLEYFLTTPFPPHSPTTAGYVGYSITLAEMEQSWNKVSTGKNPRHKVEVELFKR